MLFEVDTQTVRFEALCMWRVGQNRTYAPCITVCLVISLPKIMSIHRVYMALADLHGVIQQFGWFLQRVKLSCKESCKSLAGYCKECHPTVWLVVAKMEFDQAEHVP